MAVKDEIVIGIVAQDRVTKPIKKIQSSIIRFVGAISASLAAVRVVAFPIQQALDFDRAMRDVQKTTGFTDNQINTLSASLNRLGTQLAVSQQELAKIAAVGGQLGLGGAGVEAIRQFTESVARAQVTLGLTAESAAELGAQLLNIFDVDVSRIENVFSLVNELTNNSVANAEDLGDIMKRVGNIANLTIQQTGALAAFARELGITAEVAGTSYAKFFTNLSTKAEDFANILGVTFEEWIKLVDQDAVNALFRAAEAISKMDSAAKAENIKELFGGGRLFSFASKIVNEASNNFERFYDLLDKGNVAFAEGTSSIEEYDNILKSVKEQFNVVANDVRGLAIEVGQTLLPQLERLATALREFLTGNVGRDLFLELGKTFQEAAGAIERFLTSLVDSNVEWGKFLDRVALVLKALAAFIGLQLAQHVLAIAVRTFQWLKSLQGIGTKVLEIAASYSRLKAAQIEANKATQAGERARSAGVQKQIAGVRELQRAYLGLQDSETRLTKQQLERLKLYDIEAARALNSLDKIRKTGQVRGAEKLSSDLLGVGFSNLDIKQQKLILDLQRKHKEVLEGTVASTQNLLQASKARYEAELAGLRKQRDALKRNSSEYKKLDRQIRQVNKQRVAESKAIRRASREAQVDIAILNKAIASNAAAYERSHVAALRAAGATNTFAKFAAKAAASSNALASALKVVGAALGKITKVGKGVLSFFGGWVGLLTEVAFATFIFWDDITDAFTGGARKLTEKALREQRAAARKLQEEAKQALSAFESAVNRKGFASGEQLGIVNVQEALDTQGLAAYTDAVARLADGFVKLTEAVSGADVLLISVEDSYARNAQAIDKLRKELLDLREEQKKVGFQDLTTTSANYETRAKILEEASKREKEINKELEHRLEIQRKLLDVQKTTEDLRARLAAEAVSQVDQLRRSGSLTTELAKVLELQYKIRKVEEERGRIAKRIADIQEGAARRAENDNAQPVLLDKEQKQVDDLNAEFLALQANLNELVPDLLEFRKALTPSQLSISGVVSKADLEVQKQFVDKTKELADANLLSSQDDFNKKIRERLGLWISERERVSALLERFKEYREPFDRLTESIDGMFDNIGKTVKRTQKELTKLSQKLDEILAKRELELGISDKQAGLDDKLVKKQEEINKKFDERIKREAASARSSGRPIDKELIKKLEKQRKAELDAAKAASKVAKEEIKADEIRKNAVKSVEDLNSSMEELISLQEKITSLSKDTKLLDTDKGRRQLQDYIDRFKALVEEIDAGKDASVNFVEELASIDTRKPRFLGDTGKGKLLVSNEELRQFSDIIKQILSGYDTVKEKIIESAQVAGGAMSKALNNEQSSLDTELKSLGDRIGTITKSLGADSQKIVQSVVAQWREAFKQLPDSYLEAKQAIEGEGGIDLSNLLDAKKVLEALSSKDITEGISKTVAAPVVEALKLVSEELKKVDFSIPQESADKLASSLTSSLKNKPVDLTARVIDFDVDQLQRSLEEGVNGRPFNLPVTLKPTNLDEIRIALSKGAQQNAAGGYIRGPGTGTSDSILSWLSNGEYVIRAKAVQRYGVSFFERINNMMLPKSGNIPGFALGGLVGDIVNNTLQTSLAPPSERVQVDVNVGDSQSTLFGEREQVRRFVESMKRINRGS